MSVGYLFFCARCSAFRYFCWLALPPCRAATQGNQQKTLRRVLVFCWLSCCDAGKSAENFASCPLGAVFCWLSCCDAGKSAENFASCPGVYQHGLRKVINNIMR